MNEEQPEEARNVQEAPAIFKTNGHNWLIQVDEIGTKHDDTESFDDRMAIFDIQEPDEEITNDPDFDFEQAWELREQMINRYCHRGVCGQEVAFTLQNSKFGDQGWFSLLGPMLEALGLRFCGAFSPRMQNNQLLLRLLPVLTSIGLRRDSRMRGNI
mmetsp:Transcript_20216/g.31600  ORF Transcript_20216/g.31600 Transcript_20216/m.31600 type:complete len:157 (+) Transcript_20216:108-578(+)